MISLKLGFLVAFIAMFVFMLLKMPVGLSIMSSSILFFILVGKNSGMMVSTIMGRLVESNSLFAVPLFIFAASVMNGSSITEHMFNFCKSLVGERKGALAYINIIISLIFAGMSGSAMADAAGIGLIELREMKRDGYDMSYSAAITASTAVLGPIFPPSIAMVVYAMLAEVSVGSMFMGGVIPAILLVAGLMAYTAVIAHKRNFPKGIHYSGKEFWRNTLKAFPALMTPVILLVGVYTGFVTATEAGVLCSVYAMLIATFIYKQFSWKKLWFALIDTVISSGKIMLVIFAAYSFSHIISMAGIAQMIAQFFLSLTSQKWIFLLVINILFILLGCFLPMSVSQYVFIPLILPIAKALGIDLVHLGVILTINMQLGTITPPYGILVFITANQADAPLHKVFREAVPMALIMYATLFLMTFVPQLVTWLPGMM